MTDEEWSKLVIDNTDERMHLNTEIRLERRRLYQSYIRLLRAGDVVGVIELLEEAIDGIEKLDKMAP